MTTIADAEKKLTAAIVLGTTRCGIPSVNIGGLPGEALQDMDAADIERELLTSAALVVLYRRAGTIMQRTIDSLPTPAETDQLPACSPAMALLIERMLKGEYRRVLQEALTLLVEQEQRLSYGLLPELLDLGSTQKQLRPVVRDVIGKRGQWLAAQNPVWSYAAQPIQVEQSTSNVRSLENWKKESAPVRTSFIKSLLDGLSLDDEPVLQTALSDKSADVRRAALNCLCRLPESATARLILATVQNFLIFSKTILGGIDVEVKLPKQYDPTWKQFCIEEKSWIKDIGDQTWQVSQWLGLVPPEVWSSTFKLSPEKLLSVISRSQWADCIRLGWTRGLAVSNDASWKYAIIKYWSLSEDARTSLAGTIPSINELGEEAPRLILELISSRQGPLYDGHPAIRLLQQFTGRWPDKLARAVITSFKQTANEAAERNIQFWMCLNVVDTAGYLISPALFEEMADGWPTKSPYWQQWRKPVENFLEALNFRKTVREELLS